MWNSHVRGSKSFLLPLTFISEVAKMVIKPEFLQVADHITDHLRTKDFFKKRFSLFPDTLSVYLSSKH